MSTARVLYHMMRADFLERTRRYSFLITLGFAVYAAYMFLPPNNSTYITMRLGTYRGIYNSAWVGMLEALLSASFLSLAGFYLVKNTIDRDLQTRVGQVLAATPLSRPVYTVGKALSNFAFLAVMVAVLAITAGATQWIRGEDTHLNLWKLLSPFVVLTLPVLAVTAALAILFETIPGLRRGFGNVVYFFAWGMMLSVSAARHASGGVAWLDVTGIHAAWPSMLAATQAAFPAYDPTRAGFSMGIAINDNGKRWLLSTFVWDGMAWKAEVIAQRLFWIVVALVIALTAAAFFHRFDPARRFFVIRKHITLWERLSSLSTRKPATTLGEDVESAIPHAHLTPLPPAAPRFRFFSLVAAELRLMLKGGSWGWRIIALGLIIAGAVNSPEAGRGILTFAWIWPLLLWSPMGTREARHSTDRLIFSSAHSLGRQLPAAWLAGVILAALLGSGVALRWFLAGDWQALASWAVGACFIPSLALALGVWTGSSKALWTGSSKAFEILYLLLWYLGPANRTPDIDFLGASPQSFAAGAPFHFLIAGAVLFTAALLGRRRQVCGYAH